MATNEQVLREVKEGFQRNGEDHEGIKQILSTHEIRLTGYGKDICALQEDHSDCKSDRSNIWGKVRKLWDIQTASRGYKAGILAVLAVVVTLTSIFGTFLANLLLGN